MTARRARSCEERRSVVVSQHVTPSHPTPAERYARSALAPGTVLKYTQRLKVWRDWLDAHEVEPFEERDRAADWLAELADEGRSWTWIRQALNALRWEWGRRGWNDALPPSAAAVVKGIKRKLRGLEAPTPPFEIAAWRKACRRLAASDTLRDARDRVIAVFGFLAALRVSDLVGLRAEDVSEVADPSGRRRGLQLILRTLKGRPGDAVTVILPEGHDLATSPIDAWRRYRAFPGVGDHEAALPGSRGSSVHPAPLTTRALPKIARRLARLGGQDPRGISAHSLRAGLAHALAARGASVAEVLVLVLALGRGGVRGLPPGRGPLAFGRRRGGLPSHGGGVGSGRAAPAPRLLSRSGARLPASPRTAPTAPRGRAGSRGARRGSDGRGSAARARSRRSGCP